jgi:hypothetical protein
LRISLANFSHLIIANDFNSTEHSARLIVNISAAEVL